MPCLPIQRAGLALAIFILGAISGTARSEAPAADESEIRALMVFNLTKFIDWPESRFEDAHTPFLVCVSADESFENQVETLFRGKQTHGRPVVVRRMRLDAHAVDCHLLFLSNPRGPHLAESLRALNKASVLTVSDQHIARDGTIVGLPFVDNRIKIEIDAQAATQARLDVSSRLLGLAEVRRP